MKRFLYLLWAICLLLTSLISCSFAIEAETEGEQDTAEENTPSEKRDSTGFAVTPYETYDTNGMLIKERSPYTITFVCAYSCGRYGYIPSSIDWDAGGYEVDTCKYAKKGTGEMLVDEFTGLLNQLK